MTGMHLVWKLMTNYKRGDVILVLYPNSDLLTYKKRPALVVQADDVNTQIPQRIVALITSNLNRTGATRVRIYNNSSVSKQMGLVTDSVVMVDNLATIQDREVDRVIGDCPIMAQVDIALKKTFGL